MSLRIALQKRNEFEFMMCLPSLLKIFKSEIFCGLKHACVLTECDFVCFFCQLRACLLVQLFRSQT